MRISSIGKLMAEMFHGGRLDAAITQYGGDKTDWIDLSTGINPNGYPFSKIDDEIWQRLPDEGQVSGLLDAARRYYGVPEGTGCVAANGTQAIIEALPHVINSNRVGIVSPTYNEHAYAWRKNGAQIVEYDDPHNIDGTVEVLVVVNPNNPDGCVWQPSSLVDVASKVQHLVVDEAFCDCSPDQSLVSDMPSNAIVLRSFGKFFGLAGLRLGFAVCSGELAKTLDTFFGPWAVSGPALAIGSKALRDDMWIRDTREKLAKRSDELKELLEKYAFSIDGQNPLFLYVSHPDCSGMYEHLAQNHILVRNRLASEHHLRLGLPANTVAFNRLEEVLRSYG